MDACDSGTPQLVALWCKTGHANMDTSHCWPKDTAWGHVHKPASSTNGPTASTSLALAATCKCCMTYVTCISQLLHDPVDTAGTATATLSL